MFQFTRPRGARRLRSSIGVPLGVSIHAPAWGATLVLERADADDPRFNSRARVGRDMAQGVLKKTAELFQFTRPRGARQEVAE